MPMDPVPESLAPFFQEYRLSELDTERSKATIIERTLLYGNRMENRWLFERYPRSQIMDWISHNGAERLPEPHLTFWKLILGMEP
jgi:hypothetical protein